MNVKFCLAFPREAVSVPVMRRVLGDTLRNLGVADECVGDILVAVTEACTNVLRHGGPARRYEVVTSVGAAGCVVEVVDSGLGTGPHWTEPAMRRQPGMTGDLPAVPAAPAKARAAGGARTPRPRRPAGRAAPRRETLRDAAAVAATGPRGRRPERTADDQMIALLPESGRGLQIMRALVDDVTLRSSPGQGTVVSMRKRLAWRHDAPLPGLSAGDLRDAG